MIGPLKKGTHKTKISPLPKLGEDSFESFPNYVCYKAALKKERNSYKSLLSFLGIIYALTLFYGGHVVNELTNKLRSKEYIVYPEFISVKAGTITDEEILGFVRNTLDLLETFTPKKVESNLYEVAERMEKSQKVLFLSEVQEIIEWVEEENISINSDCTNIKIVESGGHYRVDALCKKEVYSSFEHLDSRKEKINMKLRLLPISRSRKRLIEIVKFQRKSI